MMPIICVSVLLRILAGIRVALCHGRVLLACDHMPLNVCVCVCISLSLYIYI